MELIEMIATSIINMFAILKRINTSHVFEFKYVDECVCAVRSPSVYVLLLFVFE